MSKMQKLRYVLIVAGVIMIAANSTEVNFNNLSWEANKGSYLGIISMLFLILSMVITIKHVNKNPEK